MKNSPILTQGSWSADEVIVRFSNQSYTPSAEVQQYIDQQWQKLVNIYPKMFNGEMLRLLTWKNDDRLEMHMGTTSFAAYLATRPPEFKSLFPNQERANPQGMNIIPVTSDRKILVTRRSLNSEQNPGTLNFIGGYMNTPKEAEASINVRREVEREIFEELGVETTKIQNVVVQGLGYDPVHCHPELFTVAYLAKSSDEILTDWHTAQDAKEANNIMFFSSEELIELSDKGKLPFPTCWSFEIGLQIYRSNTKE